MRIYNRNSRQFLHYTLRIMGSQFTEMDWWAFVMAITLLTVIILMPSAI